MDWSAVQWSEVADSLREAEWTESAPRPAREFLGGRFGVPSSAKKLVSRIKCNAWFYRANYALLVCGCFLFCFWRNPMALMALAFSVLAALCWMDSFAAALDKQCQKVVRKLSPTLAVKLRNASNAAGRAHATPPGGRRSRVVVRICGVERRLVQGGATALAALLLWATGALMTLTWALLLGFGLSFAHAALRSPNLKARLSSVGSEFRAVWRGYSFDQPDGAHQL